MAEGKGVLRGQEVMGRTYRITGWSSNSSWVVNQWPTCDRLPSV